MTRHNRYMFFNEKGVLRSEDSKEFAERHKMRGTQVIDLEAMRNAKPPTLRCRDLGFDAPSFETLRDKLAQPCRLLFADDDATRRGAQQTPVAGFFPDGDDGSKKNNIPSVTGTFSSKDAGPQITYKDWKFTPEEAAAALSDEDCAGVRRFLECDVIKRYHRIIKRQQRTLRGVLFMALGWMFLALYLAAGGQ